MEKIALLDYREAADFIGLSEYTLRRYVSMGKIAHVKLGSKLVRFEPDSLRRWVESRRVEPNVHGR